MNKTIKRTPDGMLQDAVSGDTDNACIDLIPLLSCLVLTHLSNYSNFTSK